MASVGDNAGGSSPRALGHSKATAVFQMIQAERSRASQGDIRPRLSTVTQAATPLAQRFV